MLLIGRVIVEFSISAFHSLAASESHAGLITHIAGPTSQSLWFHRSRVGPRSYISSKIPGNTGAAGPIPTVWNHYSNGSSLEN